MAGDLLVTLWIMMAGLLLAHGWLCWTVRQMQRNWMDDLYRIYAVLLQMAQETCILAPGCGEAQRRLPTDVLADIRRRQQELGRTVETGEDRYRREATARRDRKSTGASRSAHASRSVSGY
jgi:hypothetical protein